MTSRFSLALFFLLAWLGSPVRGAVVPAVQGLDAPVRVAAPNGDPRLFVVERTGRIRVFNQDGSPRGVFLDISDQISSLGEGGLLGLAFAPNFFNTGRFYINYTDLDGSTRVDRFRVIHTTPDQAVASSQENLLIIPQPAVYHNGGHLAFGSDGMLYVGMGDGGNTATAQDGQSLLGKMLRLDVDQESGYSIPEDNPFVEGGARPEIWAMGLRNPWGFSFDGETGDLYIADVGQNNLEEVDILPVDLPGGQNLGWPLMEGGDCYEPATGCNDGSLLLPEYTYTHGGDPYRCSISGGEVYRGRNLPSLQGRYLFSDYCSNQIWALRWSAQEGVVSVVDMSHAMTPPSGSFGSVVAFGHDGFGEMYIVDMSNGVVYRVESAVSPVPEATVAALRQNVPNPFNPSTRIDFRLEKAGPVTLEILDLGGRRLATLVNESLAAGSHQVVWDGTDDGGAGQGAGIYLYRLTAGGVSQTRKMALVE